MAKIIRSARTAAQRIPVYQLYGEREQWPTPDLVHCELIIERSRLHDWEIKIHQHHGLLQLLYLKGGTARVVLDEHEHAMQPGHLVLVPQMCVHGFRFDPGAHGHVVTLAHPLVEGLVSGLGPIDSGLMTPQIFTLDADVDHYVDSALVRLDVEYRGNVPHRDALMTALLQCVFVWVGRQMSKSQAAPARPEERGRAYFRQFAQLVEQHYAQGWAVENYAKKIGITAAYLNTLCRQAAGQSALALIHQRIVLAAKRELVYTTMTISAVSDALGFTDPAYFTRFFKRLVGVSPKEFRNQAATMMELA